MSWFRREGSEEKEEELPKRCEHTKFYTEGLYTCTTDKPCLERHNYGWLKFCVIEMKRYDREKGK